MVSAWVYDHQYLDQQFDYEDLEGQYLAQSSAGTSAPELKAQLDASRQQ